MTRTIGTCSICRGPVQVPNMMVDPIPCCKNCGATPKNPFGPVMEMVKQGDLKKGLKS